ncbi:hypothetical protein ACFDTO_06950 [Microbacteriaceae bacterium 4G12]
MRHPTLGPRTRAPAHPRTRAPAHPRTRAPRAAGTRHPHFSTPGGGRGGGGCYPVLVLFGLLLLSCRDES